MRQRVVTALLLAVPVLLALTLHDPKLLFAFGLLAAGLGGEEAGRMLDLPRGIVGFFAALLFGVSGFPYLVRTPEHPEVLAMMFAALTLIGVGCAATPRGIVLDKTLRTFSAAWVALPLIAIVALHRTAHGGIWVASPALMALVPVWAGDIAAIFVGRAYGKRPLAPKISPKKTVEGSLGSLFASILAAWLLGHLLGIADLRSVTAGVAVGILGQMGDLFESWLKRRAGVKDSGTLLPGHGGVLDRIDSVLFAAPAVALILLT